MNPNIEEKTLDVSEQISIFSDFFNTYLLKEIFAINNSDRESLYVDFSQLAQFNVPLSELLLASYEDVVKAAELALAKFDVTKKIRLHFFNLPQSLIIPIKDIRSKHIGKLVTVRGVIRQKNGVKPVVLSARFECPSCGNIIVIIQDEHSFQQPQRCSCGRKGKFKLIDKDLIDAQRIAVEESHESLESGAQPKRLSVFLRYDLASPWTDQRTNPGTKVIINGVVTEKPLPSRTGGQSTTSELVLEGNYIEPLEEDFSDIKISEQEEAEIRTLAAQANIYILLRESIAPSIYGHELIKDALVLQLFGGIRKVRDDGIVTRGDTHILLIGDPGTGKSQLVKRLSTVAPKARFVSGKGVSGAGLTATVLRDELTGSWVLEGGALVLANKGYLMIDEMDKMNKEDRDAMHEGLEQQSISISKANVQATLRCETTVLAAANPKFGRFDPYLTIAEQIDMPASLISRFDLIFPVKDLPDREKDIRMSEFILRLHQRAAAGKSQTQAPISTSLLRKYVAYARQHVTPVLTDAALEEIQREYVELRNMGSAESVRSVSITSRQLEGIIRLAEASARIHLSSEVSIEDARRAIMLVVHTLQEIATDKETGRIDIDKITSGITASSRSKIVMVKEIIIELEEKIGKIIPIDDIIKEAEQRGITADKVEEALERLKRSGDIFEPRVNFISRL